MRTLEKWDKKSPINGVEAEKILAGNPRYKMDTTHVYLILNGDRVERVEDASIIKGNTGYEGTYDQVMEQLLDSINNPPVQEAAPEE